VCTVPPGNGTIPITLVNTKNGVEEALVSDTPMTLTYVPANDPRLVNPATYGLNTTCQHCDYLLDVLCMLDCAGVQGGTAIADDCKQCSLGTTGRQQNIDKDCAGICFGSNTLITKGNNTQCLCIRNDCPKYRVAVVDDAFDPLQIYSLLLTIALGVLVVARLSHKKVKSLCRRRSPILIRRNLSTETIIHRTTT